MEIEAAKLSLCIGEHSMKINKGIKPETVKKIKNLLDNFNVKIAGDYNHVPIKLSIEENGEVIGGLLGGTYWNYLYIDILVITEKYQKRGLGSKLLCEAEEIAISRKCQHACLDTHDFQGLPFYQKFNYQIVGTLPDLPLGYNKYTLYKKLNAKPT